MPYCSTGSNFHDNLLVTNLIVHLSNQFQSYLCKTRNVIIELKLKKNNKTHFFPNLVDMKIEQFQIFPDFAEVKLEGIKFTISKEGKNVSVIKFN